MNGLTAELCWECRIRPGLRFRSEHTCRKRRVRAETKGDPAMQGCLDCEGPLPLGKVREVRGQGATLRPARAQAPEKRKATVKSSERQNGAAAAEDSRPGGPAPHVPPEQKGGAGAATPRSEAATARRRSRRAETAANLGRLVRDRVRRLREERLARNWGAAELAARDVEDLAEVLVLLAGG